MELSEVLFWWQFLECVQLSKLTDPNTQDLYILLYVIYASVIITKTMFLLMTRLYSVLLIFLTKWPE